MCPLNWGKLTFDDFKPGQLIPATIPDGYGLLLFTLLLVSAHLLGHLLDNPAHWFTYRLSRKPYEFAEKALERSKRVHAELDIHFQPNDRGILFSMLRQRNLEHAHTINSYEANSIMLRNVSLGFFLLGCLEAYSLLDKLSPIPLTIAIGSFALSYLARKRSYMFHSWFWTDIFESSLRYGGTLQDVIAYDHKLPITAPDKPAGVQDSRPQAAGVEMKKNTIPQE